MPIAEPDFPHLELNSNNNLTLTRCPLDDCREDLTSGRGPAWHLYKDHQPSDFGLTPLWDQPTPDDVADTEEVVPA